MVYLYAVSALHALLAAHACTKACLIVYHTAGFWFPLFASIQSGSAAKLKFIIEAFIVVKVDSVRLLRDRADS